MATFVLVRTGLTDFDKHERILGALDLPLNEDGRKEMEGVIQELKSVPLESVFAAPCNPAKMTAELIGQALSIPVRFSEDLCNLHHGLWQGMLVDDIRRKSPRIYKQWREAPQSICPPEGETVEEALTRVRRALTKPLKRRMSVAVVAPEPVASVVEAVLSGGELRLPGPPCESNRGASVQFIHLNGELEAAAHEHRTRN